MSNIKVYVVDTNVLLHDPDSLMAFSGHLVVLPLSVISTLDRIKKDETRAELSANARHVLKALDALREHGNLVRGVRLPHGGALLVCAASEVAAVRDALLCIEADAARPELLATASADALTEPDEVRAATEARLAEVGAADNAVLRMAVRLRDARLRNVVLVTKDLSARLQADALALRVEDYRRQRVDGAHLYKGYRALLLSDGEWRRCALPRADALHADAPPLPHLDESAGAEVARALEAELSAEEAAGGANQHQHHHHHKGEVTRKGGKGDDEERDEEEDDDEEDGDGDEDVAALPNACGTAASSQHRVHVNADLLQLIGAHLDSPLHPNEFVCLYRDRHHRSGAAAAAAADVAGAVRSVSPGSSAQPLVADAIVVNSVRHRKKSAVPVYGADLSAEDMSLGMRLRGVRTPQPCWSLTPRSDGQRMAVELLNDPRISIVTLVGVAGTGKTLLALACALDQVFVQRRFDHILVARPIIPLGKDLGSLPGDKDDKLYPWMAPIWDNLSMLVPKKKHESSGSRYAVLENDVHAHYERHRYRTSSSYEERGNTNANAGGGGCRRSRAHTHQSNGASPPPPMHSPKQRRQAEPQPLRVAPLHGEERGAHEYGAVRSRKATIAAVTHDDAMEKITMEACTYIRGRTIMNSIVIVDECQNLSPHEVKTVVSRCGVGSKIILTGDPNQVDAPYLNSSTNGLSYTVEKLKHTAIHGHVTLHSSQRSELAAISARLL